MYYFLRTPCEMSLYMHPLGLFVPLWANVQYVTLFLDETSLKKPEDIYEVIRERRHGNRYSAFLDRQASRDDASRDVFTHDLSTDSESSREMRALLEIWQKEPPLYAASVVEEKHGKKLRIVGTLFLYVFLARQLKMCERQGRNMTPTCRKFWKLEQFS